MDALKILEKPDSITWEYDEEADVLYLSMGLLSRRSAWIWGTVSLPAMTSRSARSWG